MEKQPSISFFEPSPSMEEFLSSDLTEHFYQPSLDMDFLLHGISTIPLYEIMEMPKQLFSGEGIEQMDKSAREFEESYRLKCSHRLKDEMNETVKKSQDFAIDKETDDLSVNDWDKNFLKYFYKDKDIPKFDDVNKSNDFASPTISKDFSEGARNFEEKRKQKFEHFFYDLNDGLYDSVIIPNKLPPSASEPEEDEDSQIQNEATKLATKFQFPPSESYSRDIDNIFQEIASYFENVPEPETKNFPFSSDEEEQKEKNKSKKEIKNKRSNETVLIDNRTKKSVVDKGTQYEEMPAISSLGPAVALKSTVSAGELSKNCASVSKCKASEKVLKASSDTALKTLSSGTSFVNLPKNDVQSPSETSQKKVTPGVSKSTDTLKSAPLASVSKSKSVSNLKKDKTKEGKISDKKNKEENSDDDDDWESAALKSLISKQSKIKKSSKKKN